MLEFAQESYLLLMLAAPLLLLAYALQQRLLSRRLSRFAEEDLAWELTPSRPRFKGWIRVLLLSLALVCLSIGLARPRMGSQPKQIDKSGAEIMLVLDVSNSMLAQDYSPSRLERAKMSIARMVDALENDHVGLVIFAGSAYVQLPLTADYVSAKMFLSGISPNSIPYQGTAMEEALRKAMLCFSDRTQSGKAIVLISDGEDHDGDPVQAASEAAAAGIRVYTIGVGSATGQPIKLGGELLRDRDGNVVVTKLDEQTLQQVAEAGGGRYYLASPNEFGLGAILDDLHGLDREGYSIVVYEAYDEQYAYFYAAAFLLICAALLIGYRKTRLSLFR